MVVGDVSNGEYVCNFLLCSTSYNRAITQSTIVACGVSLSNAAQVHIVKVHSPNPPPRAVEVRDISLSQLAPRVHQFAVIVHAQQLQSNIVHG